MIRRYFDWAATAPPDGGFAAPSPFGNPSSPHSEGKEAALFLENARSRCAAVLGVRPEEIFFTSGGTESNAVVLFSLFARPQSRVLSPQKEAGNKNPLLLFSAGEHPSIRENADVLEKLGVSCAPLALDRDGRAGEKNLENMLEKNPSVRMAAIMAVQNETGAINGVSAAEAIQRSGRPVHLHCDAVQAAGKIPLDLSRADSASLSAHKIGGPRGIGLLYLRKNLIPLVRGGGQENGVRPGTENAAGAASLAACLERHAAPDVLHAARRSASRRMKSLLGLLRLIPRFTPIPADREDEDPRFSPWILQAALKGMPGEALVRALDEEGFAVSTGSACSSAEKTRPVLEAMGIDRETAFSGIRISQGWSTTDQDIEALAGAIGRLSKTV